MGPLVRDLRKSFAFPALYPPDSVPIRMDAHRLFSLSYSDFYFLRVSIRNRGFRGERIRIAKEGARLPFKYHATLYHACQVRAGGGTAEVF